MLALCARQSFGDGERARLERFAAAGVRWSRVAAVAHAQGVLPIVAANLRSCGAGALRIPAQLDAALELAILESAADRQRQLHELAADLKRLQEVELDALLLKGAALCTGIYEQPWVTVSVDVDLALRPRLGWHKDKGEERRVRRRLYRSYVECDLDGHHDVSLNGLLPLDFARIWREARPVRLHGAEAWMMSPEDLLVSLCCNACRKRYLRLKPLFDLAETLARGDALDWRRVGELAREARATGVVHAALLAARMLLDARVGDAELASLGVGRATAAAHRVVLSAFRRLGSFGGAGATLHGHVLVYMSLLPREAWGSLRGALRRRTPSPRLAAQPLP